MNPIAQIFGMPTIGHRLITIQTYSFSQAG